MTLDLIWDHLSQAHIPVTHFLTGLACFVAGWRCKK